MGFFFLDCEFQKYINCGFCQFKCLVILVEFDVMCVYRVKEKIDVFLSMIFMCLSGYYLYGEEFKVRFKVRFFFIFIYIEGFFLG